MTEISFDDKWYFLYFCAAQTAWHVWKRYDFWCLSCHGSDWVICSKAWQSFIEEGLKRGGSLGNVDESLKDFETIRN